MSDLKAVYNLPPSLIDELIAAQVTVNVKPQGVDFAKDGQVMAQAGIKAKALELCLDGKLSKVSKNLIRASLLLALEKAQKKLSELPSLDESQTPEPADAADDSLADHAVTDEDTVGYASASDEAAEDPMTAPPVPLRSCKQLYRCVSGSDSGSRYHCVARGQDFSVGMRIKSSGVVSIRVEWESPGDLSKNAGKLEAAGLKTKNNSHASVHIVAGDLKVKAAGAILMDLALDYVEVAPSLHRIVGKGA